MGHNGCDGSQASGPWAIGSGYRFIQCHLTFKNTVFLGLGWQTFLILQQANQTRAPPSAKTPSCRRVDDPAQQAAPGLDEAQSSSDEGDGARDAFDLYVSYQSSC